MSRIEQNRIGDKLRRRGALPDAGIDHQQWLAKRGERGAVAGDEES